MSDGPCSEAKDEMDDYIEEQLDKKKKKKGGDKEKGENSGEEGPQPQLAMKGTKLD